MFNTSHFVSAFVLAMAACAPHTAAQETTALTGATIIDGKGGVLKGGTILIEGARISCVGSVADCPLPEGARQQNLAGRYITPGLVDAHVHFGQTGWIDGRPDGIDAPDVYPYEQTFEAFQANPDRWHKAYLCSGTTAVYDVGGAEWTVTGPHAKDTDRSDRVHVRAAGPLTTHGSARNRFYIRGSSTQPKFLPMDSDAEVRENITFVKGIGADAVKVWFLTTPDDRQEELDNRLMLLGQLAQEKGLPMFVHATGLREAKVALRAGATMLVHSVQDQPVDQEFIDLLLANNTIYAPTLVVGSGWTRAVASVAIEKPVTIDDPNGCVDQALIDRINHPEVLRAALGARGDDISATMASLENIGRTQAIMAENLRTVHAAGGHIVLSTDAGNPLTVHGPSVYWEMEAMQAAGMTPDEVIIASTLKAAEAMKMEDQIGTLETGKIADLIVMTEDPRADVTNFRTLSHVMRKGVLKTQAELRVRK